MSRTRCRRDHGIPRHVLQIRERERRQRPEPPMLEENRSGPEIPHITDHAIVRWLETVHGTGLRQAVEAEIYAGNRRELIRSIGSGRLRLGEYGVVLLIRNGMVVSVVPGD